MRPHRPMADACALLLACLAALLITASIVIPMLAIVR